MKIIVKYLGPLSDIVGKRDETIEVVKGLSPSIYTLINILAAKYPKLKKFLYRGNFTLILNGTVIYSLDENLKSEDKLTIMPAVTGG